MQDRDKRSSTAGASWLADAFAQSADGIVFSDRDGTIVQANAAAESSFSMAPGTGRGRSLSSLEPAELGASFARFLAHALERGAHQGELTRTTPNGQRCSTSTTATLIRAEDAAVLGVLWIFRDSTGQTRLAESLQALGKRFRAIVQSATDTIVVINERREILLWNAAAERMFGHVEREVLGQPLAILFADRSRSALESWIAPLLSGRRGHARDGIRVEADAVRGDGGEFPVEVSFSAFASGRGRFASAIVRDISARRSAEHDLRRALARAQESDRLKSTFLGNVSHEIRTPLNVLLGTVEMLVEHWRTRGDETQDPAVEAMKRAGKRLVDNMGRVLDYARLSATDVAAQPERVLLGDLIATEVSELGSAAAEKGLELLVELDDEARAVFADRHLLSRALANLLDNAVKFTEHGVVRIRATRAIDGAMTLGIEDTGVGIDPAFLGRLFDPFTQEDSGDDRRYEGQGLGLAVAQRSVELCRATLEVESEKGRGSQFRIQFPAPRSVRRAASSPIVIVDSHDDEATWSERLGPGLDVRVVARCEEALTLLDSSANGAAALLVDLDAEAETLALVRRLRRHPVEWDLWIVGWLREARSSVVARASSAGCDEVMTPPFRWMDLGARLARRLP